MKFIEVVSESRGFLEELYNYRFKTFKFINNKKIFEVKKNSNLLYNIFYHTYMSNFFDFIGVIQILKTKTKYDYCISYNRFIKSNKPYFIILENPTALYHYRLDRKNGIYAKKIIKKYLEDKKLKAIIPISKACEKSFEKVIGIRTNKLFQIYPLIKNCEKNVIKISKDRLKCLYISSNFELKSGIEILEVAKKIPEIDFTIVTLVKNLNKEIFLRIEKLENVKLLDFTLSKEELNQLYLTSQILLHVTRQDSFPLVVLEAIKRGLVILATDIYAIPEMVEDGINGYLIEPKYRFFNKDNTPNQKVWDNRKNTIYSKYIDNNIIEFLFQKLKFLNNNRDILEKMMKNSYKFSKEKFGEEILVKKWEELIEKIDN